MLPTMAAPPPPPPSPSQTLQSPPITIVLTVVLLIFFLLGFFSIYFCRCIVEAVFHTWHLRRATSGQLAGAAGVNPSHNGLDPALIKSFPTFLYSTIKEVRKEKYALECAICLVEFNDDSFLRLLTVCYHVFHQECIDLWLKSHKTCPVCRRDLNSPNLSAAKSPETNNQPSSAAAATTANANNNATTTTSTSADAVVRIDIDKEEDILEAIRQRNRQRRNPNPNYRFSRVCNTDERPGAWRAGLVGDADRFTRSHSTGHSIVRARPRDVEDDDRDEDPYTLRLPEHVRLRILRARHWTASCEAYGLERHRFIISSNYSSPISSSSGLVRDQVSPQPDVSIV